MPKRTDLAWLTRDVFLALQRTLRYDYKIAAAVGCSEFYIRKLRTQYGIPNAVPRGGPPKHVSIWNPDVLAALIKVYGNPYRVADALGIRNEVIRNAIAKTRMNEKGDENENEN